MSANVKVLVAARISVADFVEVREVDNVVCAHPSADPPYVHFCPMCGTAKKKRVTKTKREFAKVKFAAMEPFRDMSAEGENIGWFLEWLGEAVRDRSDLGGLDLFDLNPDGWETNKRDFALGAMLFDLREDGSSSSAAMPPEMVLQFFDRFKTLMHLLGLGDHEVKVHCLLATDY